MKASEQITKVGLQIQKLNCVGLQIRRNWNSLGGKRQNDFNNKRNVGGGLSHTFLIH